MTKTVNYTPEQVAMLHAEAQPITYARANELAEEFGKTPASVRAKILSEEIAYEGKPKAPKRPKGATKAELVAEIAETLGVTAKDLRGLDKATGVALGHLLEVLPS